MTKKRLDVLIVEKYPHITRARARELVLEGRVKVNGVVAAKPGVLLTNESSLIIEDYAYVSRAGYKLKAALDHFDINVEGLVVLDSGLSTGGFSDCLLQHGVKRVYGVDVGQGQVHETLLSDERLVVMEKTNLRDLESLPERVDLVTLDLSFISVLKVMPAVKTLLKPEGKIIVLIKPQFEVGRIKGGVVKDPKLHERVIEDIRSGFEEYGFTMRGVIESPLRGAKGENREFLALFE